MNTCDGNDRERQFGRTELLKTLIILYAMIFAFHNFYLFPMQSGVGDEQADVFAEACTYNGRPMTRECMCTVRGFSQKYDPNLLDRLIIVTHYNKDFDAVMERAETACLRK